MDDVTEQQCVRARPRTDPWGTPYFKTNCQKKTRSLSLSECSDVIVCSRCRHVITYLVNFADTVLVERVRKVLGGNATGKHWAGYFPQHLTRHSEQLALPRN